MAGIAMMVGGAIVNALAFTGSNFLFSSLAGKRVDEERRRHDLALEQLSQAKMRWEQERTKYLDFLNQRIQQERKSKETFRNVDNALRMYNEVTQENEVVPTYLQHEPKLSDFYTPSDDQQVREFIFILLGTAAVGYIVYRYV